MEGLGLDKHCKDNKRHTSNNGSCNNEVVDNNENRTLENEEGNDIKVDAEVQNEDVQNEEVVIDETVLLKKQLENLRSENYKLEEENKLNSNKLKAAEDKYTNLFNEYDNYRKRTAKEKEGIFNDACEKILKEFLPVMDNLERASTASGNLDSLKEGVEMIMKSFKDALEKLEVEEISTDGEFDPNVHNAVMHIDDESFGKNQVAQVFQKGYKRGEKVIRHSMVQVAN